MKAKNLPYLLILILIVACLPKNQPPTSTELVATEAPIQSQQELVVSWVPEGHSIVKVRVVENTGELEIVGEPVQSGAQTHYYDNGYFAGFLPGYGYCPWVIDASGSLGFVDLNDCMDPNNPFAGMSEEEIKLLCTPPTDWIPVGGDVMMSDKETGDVTGIIAVQEDGTAVVIHGNEGYVLFPGQGITITDIEGKTIEFYLDCNGVLWMPNGQEGAEPQLPPPPSNSG